MSKFGSNYKPIICFDLDWFAFEHKQKNLNFTKRLFQDDICNEPARFGSCNIQTVRWFYDRKTKYCKTFNFSGCDGNKNNFPNRQVCVNFCEKTMKKEICLSQVVPGPCLYFQRRWHFDVDTLMCLPFTYGGLKTFFLFFFMLLFCTVLPIQCLTRSP